ncbi:hypothetical protein OQJ60_16785, partial [Microbulbifer thermotolerans]
VDGYMPFPANNKSAEVTKPSKRSLNLPAARVSSKLSTILLSGLLSIASMWADQVYPLLSQTVPQKI